MPGRLPGNGNYRRPALFTAAHPARGVFAFIADGTDLGNIFRFVVEGVRVDDAELSIRCFDDGANVDTAFTAKQEVGCLQRKSEALQKIRSLGKEFE